MQMSVAAARDRLLSLPSVELGTLPTSIDFAWRLRDAIGMGARLVVKRDDAIPFGFGGNKVRKLTLVAAEARDQGCDTLITCGGVQSNHARATAAAAARMGMACHIVANGKKPEKFTGNALLNTYLGAHVSYVAERTDRIPGMEAIAASLRAEGRKPYIVPLGASTPLGAMGFARGIGEIVYQGIVPDVIVSASSSGGTQAGLIVGCALYSPRTRVIGVSADDSAADIRQTVLAIIVGIENSLGVAPGALGVGDRCDVDDSMVGEGYGIPTPASREAQDLAARCEAIVTDHWYLAKAMAGLIARTRRKEFASAETVLFWHTGGQVFV